MPGAVESATPRRLGLLSRLRADLEPLAASTERKLPRHVRKARRSTPCALAGVGGGWGGGGLVSTKNGEKRRKTAKNGEKRRKTAKTAIFGENGEKTAIFGENGEKTAIFGENGDFAAILRSLRRSWRDSAAILRDPAAILRDPAAILRDPAAILARC